MKQTILLLFILVAFQLGAKPKEMNSEKRPNIIIFLTDDQAFNTIGAYGNPQVKTPNLDKLASNGVQFWNNYATTSICMASRATIMTGMYEYKTGCNFQHGPLHQSKFQKSYPVLLRQAGYYTGFAGKFGFAVVDEAVTGEEHNSYEQLPVDQFDWWAGGPGQTFYETEKNKYLTKYAEKYPHSTRAYGAACSDFIKEAVATGKPFCLSMSFKAGHRPNTPDPFFDSVYADTIWDTPKNFGRENAGHLALQSKLGRQYINLFRGFGYEKDYQQTVRNYQQLIYGVDHSVGVILEELKRQGVADNTIIIFTSDNGYNSGSHGFGGKVLPYEEGSGTPLIIFDPRNQNLKKHQTTALAGNVDIAPTVLDYAGLKIPENMDGKSLAKVVENPDLKARETLPLIQAWGSAPNIAFTIVSEDYKYIYWPFAERTTASEELFFLKTDSLEMHNVMALPEHQNALKKMQKCYNEELKKWEQNAVSEAGYQEFVVLFDRSVPWEKKKQLIPEGFIEVYQDELKKIGYEGDLYDYPMILKQVEGSKSNFKLK